MTQGIMQGDQYRIPISLEENSIPITSADIKDLEVFIGPYRKTLSNGDIEFDENESAFYVYVAQKETFSMRGDVEIQARILYPSGDVVGILLGIVNFITSASRVVLT